MTLELQQRLQLAYAAHQQGEYTRAREGYESILLESPDYADANQLLGALLLQTGSPQQALTFLQRAVALAPNTASFHGNLGIAYTRCGEHAQAITAYQQAQRLDPNNVEVLRNLAAALTRLKRFRDALNPLQLALHLDPQSAEILLRIGWVHYKLEESAQALKYFELALTHEPDNLQALAGIGQILLAQEKPEPRTVEVWRRLATLDPENPSMHNNLGTVLKNCEDYAGAEAACRAALQLMPDFFPALCNLGMVHALRNEMDEAQQMLLQSLQAAENRPSREASDPQARQAYAKVDAATWNEYLCTANSQLAFVANARGQFEAAHQALDRALAYDTQHVDSHMLRAFLHLQAGEFAKGWPEYEWRKQGPHRPRVFPVPEWRGELASFQTLLVHAEQGLGDTIQFCRYARLLKDRVGKVVWLTHRPLIQLLKSCEGIDTLVAEGEQLPPYDLHVPLMSLPAVFRSTIQSLPRQVPYLFARAELVEEWRDKLAYLDGLRIGIAWQGNKEFANDQFRRVPLTQFRKLAEIPGVQLINLQKGDGSEQLEDIDFTVHQFTDIDTQAGAFMDTAAIMKNLDLVISPCTATPHLAGALGVPVWLAKSFAAEWRWMADDRLENPWYPTMRMYRQPQLGNWEAVFERIAADLLSLFAHKL